MQNLTSMVPYAIQTRALYEKHMHTCACVDNKPLVSFELTISCHATCIKFMC